MIEEVLELLEDNKRNKNIPIWEKLNLTIEEAAAYSNIGINKIREIVKEPSCPFVLYIGKKQLVKRKLFEQYISRTREI